jgi:hypothetical protein
VGDNGLDASAGAGVCIGEGADDVFDVSVHDGGTVCDFVFEVSPRSVASSSKAVWIARRTCDEVEDGVGLSATGGCGRGLTVEAEDNDLVDLVDAELRDFRDSVDGRRAGYVTTDAESTPVFPPSPKARGVLELFVTELALELANADNFDFFVLPVVDGGMRTTGRAVDFDL